MANELTEFVFVCSSSYWRYLFLSMRTLFASGTNVQRVAVYMTGTDSSICAIRNRIRDSRVSVRHVPDIGDGFWLINKVHLCESPASRVVYLDVDVAVLQPVDQLWQGHEADLIARYADITYTTRWYPDKWKKALEAAGAGPYPFFSPGFVIFQNQSHWRIRDSWIRLTKAILRQELPLPANRFAEMYGMSLAASLEKLSYAPMENRAHGYAFLGEPPDNVIVYHLGTPGFYRHFLPLERQNGWHRRRDLPVPRPRCIWLHAAYARFRHRLRNYLLGPRAKRLDE